MRVLLRAMRDSLHPIPGIRDSGLGPPWHTGLQKSNPVHRGRKPMILKTSASFIVLAAAAMCAVAPAHAQYPAKPVRLVVPFAAGSANDTVARITAPPLSTALGRPVVIDNRPGAAGNIGAE